MKKLTSLFPFLAVAMMVSSCSKENDIPNSPEIETTGAYLSLQIATPSSRADLPDQPGTQAESTVKSVTLLVFDKNYNFISPSESSTPLRDNVFNFTVAPDAYRFFVVANPTAKMNEVLMGVSGNWNTVSIALQEVLELDSRTDLAAYTTDGAFPMVTAGAYDGLTETVLARPIDSELVDGKLSTDPAPDKATKITIAVDRMVAKFTANVGDEFKVEDERTKAGDTSAKPEGSIEGVRLNVVNKKSFIYSHINAVNTNLDDYREDPNMAVGNPPALPNGQETELTENFFWLHNYESPKFNPAGAESTEYVFENTASGNYYNYNNLTQLVIKAIYVPTGQVDPPGLPADQTTILDHKDGDRKSWFSIDIEGYGTMQMTFDGVRKFYINDLTSDETREKMDIQLVHMVSKAEAKGGLEGVADDQIKWSNEALTIEVLNSIPNGGYVAATVADEENYIVQFYQFGLNYYDVFIKHDHPNVPQNHLGRWGMVRNNHYTLSINSISGPGLPYIPDPTDPEIKDPNNPDPLKPEPADPDMAYVDVTIAVNPWTMWTQDVDL